MKISSVQGMHDMGPPDIALWQKLEQILRTVIEKAGFEELKTPLLEEEILFTQSLGTTTDIVEKEMYVLQDRGGRSLVLRPEGTASIVRAYLQHYIGQKQEQRFYYLGPMFRSERPQKGRYRQFHQVGLEWFGSAHFLGDVEVIALATQLLRACELEEVELQINSLGCRVCRPNYRQALLDFLTPLSSQLCVDCQKRLTKNPLRILDCKNQSCAEIARGAPANLDYYCDPCRQHFQGVQQGLEILKIPFQFNPRLVRGLDYYERTAFEFISHQIGSQSAIAGGGRYDGLVEELGGPVVPAIGFAVGLERLFALVSESLKKKQSSPQKIFLAGLTEAAKLKLLPLLQALRQKGWEAEMDYESPSLKSMLRKANRAEFDYVVLMGEAELEQELVQIKFMKQEKAPHTMPLSQVNDFFSRDEIL